MIVGTQYRCDNELRRDAVRASATINGIDYLEVIDRWVLSTPLPHDSPRQQTLLVHLFKPPAAPLTEKNVRVDGGVRVIDVRVVWAVQFDPAAPDARLHADEIAFLKTLPHPERIFVVRTGVFDAVSGTIREDLTGDYSQYRLSLVATPLALAPPAGFDVKLSAVDFSFKVECPTPFDCKPRALCPPAQVEEPEIDYLSKDWNSFKQLMLDRLSVIMPAWTERNPADVGVVLVELLAYAADQLSYYQDAVANEAYLGTARRRVSMRRHARLLDYPMHDGSSARAWVAINWAGPADTLLQWAGSTSLPQPPNAVQLLTRAPRLPAVTASQDDVQLALTQGAQMFEPLHDLVLQPGLSQIVFYTWGDEQCCLPKGATQATLDNTGHALDKLQPGAVLLFVEAISPETELPEDADPTHRHVVRLRTVKPSKDPLFNVDVLEIEWYDDDALPFALCLERVVPSTDHEGLVTLDQPARLPTVIRVDTVQVTQPDGTGPVTAFRWSNDGGVTYVAGAPGAGGKFKEVKSGLTATFTGNFLPGETFSFGPASVALGNVVLCDHGRTARDPLAPSKTEDLAPVVAGEKYRPRLGLGPVTQQGRVRDSNDDVVSFDAAASAASALVWQLGDVRPAITLDFPQVPGGEVWTAERDLLQAGPSEPAFVVETEDDGTTFLRFGDGVLGRLPEVTDDPQKPPRALYRVGNGATGNVGQDAIAHAVFQSPSAATGFQQIVGVRNPLAARGGLDPESIEQVRMNAPQAFHAVQERAVNDDDYAAIAERHPDVLKAVATRRWTGSWYTIFLSVERKGGKRVDDAFKRDLRGFLERYRLAGQDVEIEQPEFVPLDIALAVCIDTGYFRADVIQALDDALSNRDLPDGRRGFFHPDNFTFGQPVYLSGIVAAAMQVAGVKWIDPTKSRFRRFWEDRGDSELVDGKIAIGRLEVARLDNDPNFPEFGTLNFDATGGL